MPALGETTRRGFYVYDDKRRANPDPELKKYIDKSREIAGVTIDPKVTTSSFSPNLVTILTNASLWLTCGIKYCIQLTKLSDKDIVEMIFFPVVNEACRVLDEGIAVKAADLDISAVMGMGFPPYRYAQLSSIYFVRILKHNVVFT